MNMLRPLPAVARDLGLDHAGLLRKADEAAADLITLDHLRADLAAVEALIARSPWTACQRIFCDGRDAWDEAKLIREQIAEIEGDR